MRTWTYRLAALATAWAVAHVPAQAQGTLVNDMLAALENPGQETLYILLAMAVLQTIIIVTLSGVMKTLGGTGSVWVDYVKGRRAGTLALLLFTAGTTDALAAPSTGMVLATTQTLFWYLFVANIILFVLLVAQLVILRGMVRTLRGEEQMEVAKVAADEPSWVDTLLQRLTRRPTVEKEKDLLMHHEYDGIRELDNVLPPWWVWLFYGTIIWSAIYIINVHVVRVWPDQDTAYEREMLQAKADIEAYLALQAAAVDEHTVTLLSDAAALGSGKKIFSELCRACHGASGEGNEVGPNLTDAYWIHGGSINDVFRTIKYGVQEKGMQSWKDVLDPQEMQAVASYILSLQGSDPPGARPPQGELYEPGPPADENAEDKAPAEEPVALL